jgi:hypothetical protein
VRYFTVSLNLAALLERKLRDLVEFVEFVEGILKSIPLSHCIIDLGEPGTFSCELDSPAGETFSSWRHVD